MAIRWITPREGENVTDVAVQFLWSSVPGAKEYTVEYAYAPDFSDSVSITTEPLPDDCRWGTLIPADGMLPKAGDVYARVRADEGEWSETLHFMVNDEHTFAPLRRPIDPEHPYIVITDYSQHEWRAPYDLLPENLKPYTSIGSMGCFESDTDQLRESLMGVDGRNVPWHLYAFGPHEVDAGGYSGCPLSDVEYLLRHTKNLNSVFMVEQYLGQKPEDYHRAVYMRRLIVLCGKYGMNFIYSDGNRNAIEMPAFFSSKTAGVMKEYAKYCSVLYKQNHSHASYTVYGALLGGWEAGVCGNIGVQAENWYWNDAGYRAEPGDSFGYLQGIEQVMPPSITTQMLLTGLSMGGCIYSLEGQGWMLECEVGKKPRFSRHGRAAMTLFSAIIEHRLIPDKASVMKKLRCMLKTDLSCREQGDAWTGGVWRNVFLPIYRDPDGFALFMKDSRYFLLPIGNKYTDNDLPVYRPEDVKNPGDLTPLLNSCYPAWARGNCYMTQAGKTTIVMNSQENREVGQYYEISLIGDPIRKISGGLSLWQHFVLRETEGGAILYADAPEDSRIEIALEITRPLAVHADGPEVVAEMPDSEHMILSITPSGSPVMISLTVRGTQQPLLPRIPVDDHPEMTFLSDLPMSRVKTTGHEMPKKDLCVNSRYGKLPLYMNGMTYVHGIGMTNGTEVSFDLGGKYAGLVLDYGYDVDAWFPRILDRNRIVWDRYPRRIDLVFRIFGDGNELFASNPMKSTYAFGKVKLDVRGVRELTFTLLGTVKTAAPEEVICFDIINPRLLTEEEFASLPEDEDVVVMSAAYSEEMVNFRPQVQITSDTTGKIETMFLDE